MPYKILVYTDIHFHRWSSFSEADPDYINTRIRQIRKSLSWVCERIREERPEVVVFAGDLIHNTRSTDYAVFNQAYEGLAEIADVCVGVGADHIIMDGNHDLLGRKSDGGSCILPLSELPGTTHISVEEVIKGVRYVPFQKERIDKYDEVPLHICHMDIIENKIRGHALGKWSFKELGAKLIVSGHYHKPCEFGGDGDQNLVYVGSLLPHNFVDDGFQYHGIMTVQSDGSSYERIANPHAIPFIKYRIESDKDHIAMYKELNGRPAYFQITAPASMQEHVTDSIREYSQTLHRPTHLEFRPILDHIEKDTDQIAGLVRASDLEDSGLIAHYVGKTSIPDTLDSDRLMRLGESIAAGSYQVDDWV